MSVNVSDIARSGSWRIDRSRRLWGLVRCDPTTNGGDRDFSFIVMQVTVPTRRHSANTTNPNTVASLQV